MRNPVNKNYTLLAWANEEEGGVYECTVTGTYRQAELKAAQILEEGSNNTSEKAVMIYIIDQNTDTTEGVVS
jgi:hypothetical protein